MLFFAGFSARLINFQQNTAVHRNRGLNILVQFIYKILTNNFINQPLNIRQAIIFAPNMRVAVAFFLFLCLLLVKGHSDLYAKQNNSYPAGASITTSPRVKFGNTTHEFPFFKYNSLTEKKEDFLRVETEDDEEDSLFARKYVLLVSFFTAFVSTSVLDCFYSYFNNRLPFCSHFSYTSSYKYILQRVLRI